MKRRKITALLLTLAIAAGTLAGCGGSDGGSDKGDGGKKEGDVVNLKIHVMVPEQKDQAKVMEAVNEYTKEKIGVTVDYVFHGGSYADKIQVIIASGEEYDACFTSNWLNPYNTNVAKGAFVDIKEMLPEVAPDLMESMPESFWTAVTVNGGIYAVPNQQIAARQIGALMPKEFVDASGEKVENLQTLTEMKDYAQYAFDNYSAKVGGVNVQQAADYCGYEHISDYMSAGAIKMGDESAKVVNFYETDEWKAMLKESYDLNSAGLLDGQCAYNPEYGESQRIGKKTSAYFSGTYKPGVEAEESTRAGYDMVFAKSKTEPLITTNSVIATMYGISTTSKHPEETLKYLELVNTDPYVMNLLSYGIEGTHYEKISDNMIKPIENSGYSHGQAWAFGNVFNSYAIEGQPEDVWEQTKALNDSAKISPILGFSFDPDPVKMEIASVSKVVKEYESLTGGELPVEETNAEFVEKLKVAGIDTVLAEMQKQVDAFMEAK
ncbi:ABC transporter substrate-binding protein [Faecalicatena orotica]|uniref:Carbohydrate ABC transporter substrate-binding protein (CUT1 family) n=1 Tax=Faecalicatena orotica TaxID=1544 RepID=A0A2Y9BMH6_9FIRM|nr:ABC transporter substrate-binding protein [Faecalicatena orotica]PWJ28064.1 carbohydrate ABC transporter substrate-binding protein (CUT1 family) [Faecalicatena orotica]SSA57089.1 carbohydrate ABC transporter substrate-binding protein, CUT1 family [Faecalicatena orotica]